jgi:uncharacterized protein
MRKSVEFNSQGSKIRGVLVTPETGRGPFPVAVMGGGWCYVKEIVLPHYAEAILKSGVAVLMFDYRGLGESEGEPRQHIDPWAQIEDYKNAISFVAKQSEVDAKRIGIWGISYSGGHVLAVAALDSRVRCVVSQIPVIEGWYNSMRAHGSVGFRELTALVAEDRKRRYLNGGHHGHIPHSGDPKTEVATWPHPETREVFLKIKETDAPSHEHYSTVQSVEHVWAYDMRPFLPRILNTPTMMIVAEGDDITMWEREIPAFGEIATTKKKLFVQDNSSHMSMYSDKSDLEVAASEAASWFREWLVDPYQAKLLSETATV